MASDEHKEINQKYIKNIGLLIFIGSWIITFRYIFLVYKIFAISQVKIVFYMHIIFLEDTWNTKLLSTDCAFLNYTT